MVGGGRGGRTALWGAPCRRAVSGGAPLLIVVLAVGRAATYLFEQQLGPPTGSSSAASLSSDPVPKQVHERAPSGVPSGEAAPERGDAGHRQPAHSAAEAAACAEPPIGEFSLPSRAVLQPDSAVLSAEMLSRAIRRQGDPAALRRVATALRDGRRVRIVVFGGSVTAGVGTRGCSLPGCEVELKGNECRACAWPSLLEAWLRATYPGAQVDVHNLAVRASSTSVGIKQLRVAKFGSPPQSISSLGGDDLVIHDWAFNDQVKHSPSPPPPPPAPLRRQFRPLLAMLCQSEDSLFFCFFFAGFQG